MNARKCILAAVCAISLFGCNSIKSTMVTRDETNQVWETYPHLKGIPITLKVPTHVKLFVFEKHYLELVTVGGIQEVQPVDLDIPIRDFAQEFLYTEKIFTVDFKRPAAGSFNLRLDMTEDQYFAKIQHDVTDETIAKVSELLGKLLPSSGLFATPASGENAPDAKEIRSLVAVGVFEIDAPDFEDQVAAFLNCHINKAHDAWVVPPGVKNFKRVGVAGPNHEVPYPRQPFCPNDGCFLPSGFETQRPPSMVDLNE